MGNKHNKATATSPPATTTAEPTGPPRVFGVPLAQAAKNTDPNGLVPDVVRKCCQFLEQHGVRCYFSIGSAIVIIDVLMTAKEEGIYRLCGSHAQVLQYRAAFERGD